MSVINVKVFSIITVCRNNIEGLKATYQSIRTQSYRDYEWIVIDGASTDGTRSFLELLPPDGCRWISEPDRGLYDAMNKGIVMAAGRYLFFLNGGDRFASSDVLKKVGQEAEKGPDFIYGDSIERFANGRLLYKKARNSAYLWYGMFTHHQAMFYKKETVGDTRYRLEYKLAADYAFTSEFLKDAQEVVYLPFSICLFEGGGATSTGKAHFLGMREQWSVGRKIQKKSFIFTLATFVLHLLKHAIIRVLPGLVSRVRYKTIETH